MTAALFESLLKQSSCHFNSSLTFLAPHFFHQTILEHSSNPGRICALYHDTLPGLGRQGAVTLILGLLCGLVWANIRVAAVSKGSYGFGVAGKTPRRACRLPGSYCSFRGNALVHHPVDILKSFSII